MCQLQVLQETQLFQFAWWLNTQPFISSNFGKPAVSKQMEHRERNDMPNIWKRRNSTYILNCASMASEGSQKNSTSIKYSHWIYDKPQSRLDLETICYSNFFVTKECQTPKEDHSIPNSMFGRYFQNNAVESNWANDDNYFGEHRRKMVRTPCKLGSNVLLIKKRVRFLCGSGCQWCIPYWWDILWDSDWEFLKLQRQSQIFCNLLCKQVSIKSTIDDIYTSHTYWHVATHKGLEEIAVFHQFPPGWEVEIRIVQKKCRHSETVRCMLIHWNLGERKEEQSVAEFFI